MQRIELPLDLRNNVAYSQKVLPSQLDLLQCHLFACLEFRNTSCFFDEKAALLGLGKEDHADAALFDDGIRLRPDAGVHEQLVNIQKATRSLVEKVLALPIPIQPAGYLNFRKIQVFGGHASVIGGKYQRHLGHPQRFSRFAATEDDILHASATEIFG